MERAGHAAVCLDYGGDHPQLFVTGGVDGSKKILSDAWILDMETGKWSEVRCMGLDGVCSAVICA